MELTSLATTQAGDKIRHMSDVASLSDTSAEADETGSMSSSPRKRKRSDVERSYLDNRGSPRGLGTASGARLDHLASARLAGAQNAIRSEQWDISRDVSDGEHFKSDEETQNGQAPLKKRVQRGKRRTKKTSDGEAGRHSPSGTSIKGATAPMTSAEAQDSNPDDVEMEDPGEYASLDNGVKDEEGSEYLSNDGSFLRSGRAEKHRHKETVSDGFIERHRKVFRKSKRQVRHPHCACQ